MVCAEARQKGCHRGRGRRHRAGGPQISGRLLSVLCFPCRGPSAWCWRPLLFHSSREDHGSDRSSKPDLPSVQIAAGRFHRGGGLSFSLCSRSPWRARQKPLIAGPARPKGGPPGRARYDEGSYGHRQQSATGRRFMCFASSAMSPHSGKRPAVPLSPPGVIFSQGVSHARR